MKKIIFLSLVLAACGGSQLPGERGSFGNRPGDTDTTLQDGPTLLCSVTLPGGSHVKSGVPFQVQITFYNASAPISVTAGPQNILTRTHTYSMSHKSDAETSIIQTVTFSAANGQGGCEFSLIVSP